MRIAAFTGPVAWVAVAVALTATLGVSQPPPQLTRVIEIGCADCGSPAQFSQILDVAVDDSGRVLIVDNEAPMLRFFDRSGRWLWSEGADGMGPGEFRRPMRAAIGPRSLQVVDMTQRRVSRLGLDGKFVNSAVVRGFPAATAARGRSGELVLLIDDFRGARTLQRWTAADSGADVGPVPRPETPTPGVISFPSIAVAPDGEFAHVRDGNDYRIDRLSAAGKVLGTIIRDIQQVKRTDAEIAAMERRRRSIAARVRAERGGAAPKGPAPNLRVSGDPELKPHIAIDGLRYDAAARLWVRTLRGDGTVTVFDVFAPGGAYVGEVRVPGDVGAVSFAGRLMAAATVSDDGFPSVVVYEVR
ncbi:MAG: 6-bladed beta-propeller [Gemmatimonadaceae bacterium]